jgi:hypothetical protein
VRASGAARSGAIARVAVCGARARALVVDDQPGLSREVRGSRHGSAGQLIADREAYVRLVAVVDQPCVAPAESARTGISRLSMYSAGICWSVGASSRLVIDGAHAPRRDRGVMFPCVVSG